MNFEPGWILGVSTTVKVFIDIFIGVWAFLLAWIWSAKIERRQGEQVKAGQIWQRFPKFILGYLATFFIVLAIGIAVPSLVPKVKASMAQANVFRSIFFVHDLFLDRCCVELPKTVAGRHREAYCRVCSVPVRIHHLGRAADLMVVFPRHAAANREGVRYE